MRSGRLRGFPSNGGWIYAVVARVGWAAFWFAFSLMFYLLVWRVWVRPRGPVTLDHVDAAIPLDSGYCALVLGISKQVQVAAPDGSTELIGYVDGPLGPYKMDASRLDDNRLQINVFTLKTASSAAPMTFAVDQRADGFHEHFVRTKGIPFFQKVEFGMAGGPVSQVDIGSRKSITKHPAVTALWLSCCLLAGSFAGRGKRTVVASTHAARGRGG